MTRFLAPLLVSLLVSGCSLSPQEPKTQLALSFQVAPLLAGAPSSTLQRLTTPDGIVIPVDLPETAAGFDCYVVNVMGEDIARSDREERNPLSPAEIIAMRGDEATKFETYPGVISKPFKWDGSESSIVVSVRKGELRIVQVLGLLDYKHEICQRDTDLVTAADSVPHYDFPIFELGSAVITHVRSDRSVEISDAYTNAPVTEKLARWLNNGHGNNGGPRGCDSNGDGVCDASDGPFNPNGTVVTIDPSTVAEIAPSSLASLSLWYKAPDFSITPMVLASWHAALGGIDLTTSGSVLPSLTLSAPPATQPNHAAVFSVLPGGVQRVHPGLSFTDSTVVVVARAQNSSGAFFSLWGGPNGLDVGFNDYDAAVKGAFFSIRNSSCSTSCPGVGVPSVDPAKFHIFVATWKNDDSISIRIENGPGSSIQIPAGAFPSLSFNGSTDVIRVGALQAGTGQVEIAEVLFFNAALPSSALNGIFKHLENKYAIPVTYFP